MNIRSTSLSAYKELIANGTQARTTTLILSEIHDAGERGLTRKEISRKTGLEVNQVSGRVKELINQNRIDEEGKRPCDVSGRMVGYLVING